MHTLLEEAEIAATVLADKHGFLMQVDPHTAGGGGERAHAPADIPGAAEALHLDAHERPPRSGEAQSHF